MRPAVNAGLSVSRVGGSAQIKAMKKVAGPIRMELAQYRELQSFSQFGSDLDKDTLDRLNHGKRVMEILKQPQYKTLEVEKEVVILYAVTNKYLDDVPVEKIADFERGFFEFMEQNHNNILIEIKASMRNIKRRIKSVNSTQQITKAMNLVASSKLTKAKQNFDDTKPFFNAIRRVIANVVKGAGNTDNVFLKSREVKNTGVVILTGDRGLCGGYNTNACKTALGITEGKSASYITVGSKGFEFLKHKGCDFAQNYTGISEKPTYEDARDIG